MKSLNRTAMFALGSSLIVISTLIYLLIEILRNNQLSTWGIGLLFLAIILLPIMIHFAQKIQEDESSDDNFEYVLSYWRIETLKAAGVPADVTKCLENILGEYNNTYIEYVFGAGKSSSQNELTFKKADESGDNWLTELQKKLGDTRLKESREVILKYTQRELPQSQKESEADKLREKASDKALKEATV